MRHTLPPPFLLAVVVSIHAPARGATPFASTRMSSVNLFQSTHPHGVRLGDAFDRQQWLPFQSTHPHGVRPRGEWRREGVASFNPRTRTGCDTLMIQNQLITAVSIHAPARGATLILLLSAQPVGVSIHAPARGATASCTKPFHPIWFQSTHPHGVRPRRWRRICPTGRFNPRTRTGCDGLCLPTASRAWRFQSTHPHGVRQYITSPLSCNGFGECLCEPADSASQVLYRRRLGRTNSLIL